jgi:hypothetical protein
MAPIFAIDTRGTARLTTCIGPWALKVARNATGRRARLRADARGRDGGVRQERAAGEVLRSGSPAFGGKAKIVCSV